MFARTMIGCCGLVLGFGSALAAEAVPPAGGVPPAAAAAQPQAEEPRKPDAPQKIGKVTWYRTERRIELEGQVCIEEGPLEYLAVLKGGKEYESVLAIDCSAIDLNLALIGAGYKAAGGVKKIGDPDTPKGDPVYLHVEWRDDEGKTRRVRAEELLWNQVTKKPMRSCAWVFTGSSFRRDTETKKLYFMAEEERKLIAVYRDPSAMFNSPLDTGHDDVFYVVNKKAMPAPAGYACPRHEDVTSPKTGECRICQSPLFPVGRKVKLVMEPAAADALDPANLGDGAGLVKPSDADNPPSYRPVPVPGAKEPEGQAPPEKPEKPEKPGAPEGPGGGE